MNEVIPGVMRKDGPHNLLEVPSLQMMIVDPSYRAIHRGEWVLHAVKPVPMLETQKQQGYPWLFWLTSPFAFFQFVLENMFIRGTTLLESVGLHEPAVEELRNTIRSAIRNAVIPLQAYAKQYESQLELNNNDIQSFLK